MGLMSVALDLLLLIHPMSNAQDELKEVSSSRQDLKNDMQDLEAAGFLKPCKETPDSWDFAQVPFPLHSPCLLLPWRVPTAAPLQLSFICCHPAAVLRFALCTRLCSTALCSASWATDVHGNVCFNCCLPRQL